MQSVASVAITKIIELQNSKNGMFDLKSFAKNGRVESNRYVRVPRTRRNKGSSTAESELRYVRNKARWLEDIIDTMSHAKTASSERITKQVIKNLGKRFDLTVVEKESIQLDVSEVISLRDTADIGTNAIYRLASALQALRPDLELFPPAVKAMIAVFEKTDNFEMGLELLYLTVNKDDTKKKLLPFVWMKKVWRLVQSMVESSTADGTFESSETFMKALYEGKIVLTYNIDKGGNDIIVSIRLVNRAAGNSMKFTFPIATVGGPVIENYENELESIFNPKYPIGRTLQDFCDDSFFVLRLRQASKYADRRCRCIMFKPSQIRKKEACSIAAELLDECVSESSVEFDEDESSEGCTVEVEIPLDTTKLSVRLVTQDGNDKVAVGVQILRQATVIHSRRFLKPLHRTRTKGTGSWTMNAQLMQVMGFPSHDMKQQVVLIGIPSNSCKRPCTHCIEPDDNFNSKHRTKRMWNTLKSLNVEVCPVCPVDPTPRIGRWSSKLCATRFKEEVGSGTLPSKAHEKLINARCASVTRPPLLDEHGKNSGEVTHMSMGVDNKKNDKIRKFCRAIDEKQPFFQSIIQANDEVKSVLATSLSLESNQGQSLIASLHRESNKF